MKLCSNCRREAGIFEVRRKSYMGFWGTDCLFKLDKLYRDLNGNWRRLGWLIRRLNAPQTPEELVQGSIRKQIDMARDKAKERASFWHRVALECASRRSGIGILGHFRERFMVRAITTTLLALGYCPAHNDQLVNEAIARRFPKSRIKTEVTVHERP